MTAIEASSGTYRCRVDGTIVLSVEIEPRFRDEFQKLFGTPGTPMALAALKQGYAAAVETVKEAEKPKGGPLSRLAGLWCNRVEFQEWLWDCTNSEGQPTDDGCADIVRAWCGVDSRAEIDHSPAASAAFQEFIRGPFIKHCQARGIVL